ncbi:MAG: hypothetical protein AB7F43_09180 [Bacteriovoracia bacterium]
MIFIVGLLSLFGSISWASEPIEYSDNSCSVFLVEKSALAELGSIVTKSPDGIVSITLQRKNGGDYSLVLVPTNLGEGRAEKVEVDIDRSVAEQGMETQLQATVREPSADAVTFAVTAPEQSLKSKTSSGKIKTWMVEGAVVAAILSTVAHISGGGKEWIGTLAVLLSFFQFQVANRLEEKEGARELPEVDCFKWNTRYFISKEALWITYFILSQTYTALAGAGIFISYPIWRKIYRRYYPLTR